MAMWLTDGTLIDLVQSRSERFIASSLTATRGKESKVTTYFKSRSSKVDWDFAESNICRFTSDFEDLKFCL